MEQESYYFKVGLFVMSMIVTTVVVLSWFSGRDSNSVKQTTFAIYFDGSVEGLTVGSMVKLKGIKVGTVRSIAFSSLDNDAICVLVDVDDRIKIRDDSVASLQMQGITGTAVIALEYKNPQGERLQKKPGEEYAVIPSGKSQLEKVFASVPELLEEITKLTKQGQQLLSEQNIAAINQTLLSLSDTAQSLDKFVGKNKSLSVQNALADLSEFLTEGKVTMREVKMLARTLREDPSIVLYGTQHDGVKVK